MDELTDVPSAINTSLLESMLLQSALALVQILSRDNDTRFDGSAYLREAYSGYPG
jgi:hypothetical protein